MLWVPERGGAGFEPPRRCDQRPGPAYVEDLVGSFVPRGRRALVDAAYDAGVIRRDGDPEWWDDVPVRVEAIPVRRDDLVLAVVARNTNLISVRTPSRLELAYLESAALLAKLVAEGRFPDAGTDVGGQAGPRVGDGFIRLGTDGVVTYASPNALSAYRRLGLTADLVGERLGEVTARLAPPRVPSRKRWKWSCGAGAPVHRGRGQCDVHDVTGYPAGPRRGARRRPGVVP